MPLTTLAANLLDLRLEFLNPILAEDLDTRPKRLLEECWRMTFGHPNDLDLGLRARPIARGLDPLLYPLQILLYLFSLHHSLGFRSEEHTSELQSRGHLVCRLLLEKHNSL